VLINLARVFIIFKFSMPNKSNMPNLCLAN